MASSGPSGSPRAQKRAPLRGMEWGSSVGLRVLRGFLGVQTDQAQKTLYGREGHHTGEATSDREGADDDTGGRRDPGGCEDAGERHCEGYTSL